MDFAFTEDQELLRSTVREFAEREIAPGVMELDEKQEFPHEILKKAGEMGLLGIIFPEKYGGAEGPDHFDPIFDPRRRDV